MAHPAIRKTALLTILLILCLGYFGQAQVQDGAYRLMLKKLLAHSVPELQVQQLAADSSAVLLLDAREPREYAVSHIAGAVHVGYDHFRLSNLPDTMQKQRRIVVYCSVGYRSEKVAEQLRSAGFTDVSNLYGGIFEWVNQGHPVQDRQGPTQRVHAYDRTWGIWLRKGKKVYR
ncbi:MAG TPA: rhodanese-like domain-containing protein [Saprospiraceae bacterium]|nr:rhodanese-like domain-containing protein [Saprospiraceae bacterium]